MIRNITFEPENGSAEFNPLETTAPEEVTLRLRKVTVSPHEEYALRPGTVHPIADEFAAAILAKIKGRATIGNKGVIVDRKELGGKHVYFHENSKVLNDFVSRERRLWYVINSMVPEVIHLLDDNGCHIESLPLRERPAVLDNEAQVEQLRKHRVVINRAAARLQKIHAPDTAEKLETLAHNSREMQRVVQVLPAPCSETAPPVQPHRSTQGEILAEVTRQTSIRVTREKAAGTPSDIVRRRAPRQSECPF